MSATPLRRASTLLPSFRSAHHPTCRHRAPRIPASSLCSAGRIARTLPSTRRDQHTLAPLRYPLDEPLGKLWTTEQLRMVAVDYQEGLLERLNDEIKGTEYENKSVVDTVIGSAKKREDALIFNYASQAMNNSFFLDTLLPTVESTLHHMSHSLDEHLRKEFGSITQFVSYMSAAAMGMSGSGWVWLAIDRQNRLAIIGTYGAGTLLIRERQQANPMGNDAPLLGGTGISNSAPTPPGNYSNPQIHTPSNSTNFKWFGQTLNPIFCISVHEHCWLKDYGVWGKEEYLKQFWTVLDWGKVSRYHERWVERNDAATSPKK
ncbi:manganese and iron superoxide dismutase [Dacryopinax primogenitus]|uniref:Manganese and iron superoxide dismutase n=1 Tax=Dacryopinax primogenitus (strain DJM 731) TaxID=1858805 RepID=M5FRH5_DACPD|nr:manganese and iron superoxide dismutase [Dacryopinax primogenitus]EJT97589.1 manganese and iron superoxide dismutase [Dacryopinax primogenitus]